AHQRPPQSVDRALEEDVLATGQVGVEAGAELEQRADPPAHRNAARGRLDDSGDEPQQRRLSRAVAPDETECAARVDVERDVAQRPDVLPAIRAAEQDVLERPRRARVPAEPARRVSDLDLTGPHAVEGTPRRRLTAPSLRMRGSAADRSAMTGRHVTRPRPTPLAHAGRSRRAGGR